MKKPEIVPERIRFRAFGLIGLTVISFAVLQLSGLHNILSSDAEGIGVLVQIIGTLYSVVYAFATYVIWDQFAAVEDEIVKETGALKDLVLFSKPLKEQARDPILRAVRGYARGVIESEWGVLSRGESTERTDRLFSVLISAVTEVKTCDDSECRLQSHLLQIASRASAHREERLAVSAKRIPRTLLLFVTLTAFTIPFLMLLFPFHNLGLGMASIALATMLLLFAHFVLTDLDNPFEGTWNVESVSFSNLASKSH